MTRLNASRWPPEKRSSNKTRGSTCGRSTYPDRWTGTEPWNILNYTVPIFNRKYIFNGSIFHMRKERQASSNKPLGSEKLSFFAKTTSSTICQPVICPGFLNCLGAVSYCWWLTSKINKSLLGRPAMTFGIKGARNWKTTKTRKLWAAVAASIEVPILMKTLVRGLRHGSKNKWAAATKPCYTGTLQVPCYSLPTQLGAIYE